MSVSDELFKLIKSLTKSEKRYFKLVSSLQSGEKNYIKLFDAVELQDRYDEIAIKKKFAKDTFIKHLPSEKNQLYSQILKSLRGFYANKSAESILKEKSQDIQLLFDKSLYSECVKSLKKAKKIALAYEKFEFLIQCIDWEKKIMETAVVDSDLMQQLKENIKEKKKCIAQLKNEIEYQQLSLEIHSFIQKRVDIYTKIQQEKIVGWRNHPLLEDEKSALSLKAKTNYYFIKGKLCLELENNSQNALKLFEKGVDLMLAQSFLLAELPIRYLEMLSCLSSTYLDVNDWENALLCLNELKNLENKKEFSSTVVQLVVFEKIANTELLIYLFSKQFTKVISETAPGIDKGLKKFKGKISQENKLLFHYAISRAYFGLGDLQQALKYINLVLTPSFLMLRNDVYAVASCVSLLIHYELGNSDLINYMIKSLEKNTNKKQPFYKFEQVFLKNIKKINKLEQKDDLPVAFVDFKIALQKMLEKPSGKKILKHFDFISWLDANSLN